MKFAALQLVPESASDHASRVDLLFLALMAASGLVILILLFLVGYSVIRYHAGSDADRSPIRLTERKLEVTWTVIPLLIFTGLFAWGAWLYLDGDRIDGEAGEVYVVGRQWMWEMRYPDGRRAHNELVVPLGEPVRLIMTSEDVIHSFYIPAMRTKHDVVPGRYVSLSFTPTRAGGYPIYCAEYCGTKHSAMTGMLRVLEPDAYAEWLERGKPLTSLAEQGRELFAEKGCAGCHMPDGSARAPLLDGLYGNSVPLENGDFAEADEQYLHDSILRPMKQVAAGYEPVMPSYQDQLEETEVIALVEYIKSLRDAGSANREQDMRPKPEIMRKEEP